MLYGALGRYFKLNLCWFTFFGILEHFCILLGISMFYDFLNFVLQEWGHIKSFSFFPNMFSYFSFY